MTTENKRGPGRPPRPLPDPIPDSAHNVLKALLSTPPKRRCRYLRHRPR